MFYILLFLTELILVNAFATLDLSFFYILFEMALVPVFLIIGIWGTRPEKISAALYFFIYTVIGSFFMIVAILYIYSLVGTTNILVIQAFHFEWHLEYLFWLSFFFAFAVKVPMFPFHLWLPKAHVEAPTAGSVLLAGILLKLGTYGFLRFLIPVFPIATEFFRPFVVLLAITGFLYSSIMIFMQSDLKRLVAYSSIAHMNFVVLGCFINNPLALQGAILLMIAHGFVSSALFLLIGILYDRYKIREIYYYRDLFTIMPIFSKVFFVFILANIGFPPSLNFIAEFFILSGIASIDLMLSFCCCIALFLSGLINFWLYTKIFYNNFSTTENINHIAFFYDLTRREFFMIIPLLILTFFFGFVPYMLGSQITQLI